MRKIYLVAMLCFILAMTGTLFVNIGYAANSGAGQPQYDAPVTAEKAANGNTTITESAPAEPTAQMKASSSGTVKSDSESANE